jgi:uncharacterized membrane protein
MTVTATGPAPAPPARTRPATPAQLDWLTGEVRLWRTAGFVDEPIAAAILAGYHPSRRLDLSRLLLTLGAAFVGVGILWLVASNLDQLSPPARSGVVAAFWLAFLIGGELLATRREHGGPIPSPVVGAVRMLAALSFGAVVMQAAQSLQVPAYEPALLAWWGLGALVHAYVVRGTGPLVVGLLTLAGWLLWYIGDAVPDALTGVLVFFAAGVVAAAAAALHADRLPRFAAAWREIGAFVTLAALFTAALPFVTTHGFGRSAFLVAVLAVAGVAAAAGTLLGRGNLRFEPLLAVVIGVAGTLLVLWEVGDGFDNGFDSGGQATLAGWAHAAAGVVVYVAAAAWYAVLGVLRDSRRLTFVATAALVLFTTVQAFAVFAQVLQGALLFVLLGLVFAGTGWLADRARRRLTHSLADQDGTLQ